MDNVKDTTTHAQENASALYVAKKLEKIANALYLVTNLFPKEEPLRSALRERAINLMSFSVRQSASGMSDSLSTFSQPLNVLYEVVTLLGMARTAGLVSEMNFDILKQESEKVLADARAEEGESVWLPQLSGGYFSVDSATLPRLSEARIKAHPSAQESSSRDKDENIAEQSHKSQTQSEEKKSTDQPVSNTKRKRRDAILDVIRAEGEVGIKEISKEVRGCSRKTIQRELNTLIDKGLVEKRGERRWSTYAIARS